MLKTLKLKISSVLSVLKDVSVEPAVFLFVTATLTHYIFFQNLVLENICLKSRGHSESVCNEIVFKLNYSAVGNDSQSEHDECEDEESCIQSESSRMGIYRTIVDNGLSILFILFMGPWSDKGGRKIPMMLNACGGVAQLALSMVLAYYKQTVTPLTLSLLETFPRALTGGLSGLQMCAYSHICDITEDSSRTVRTGIFNAAFLLGVPSGTFLASRLIKLGFSDIEGFAVGLVLYVVGILIIVFRMRNTSKHKPSAQANEPSPHASSQNHPEKPEHIEKTEEVDSSCLSMINPKRNFFVVAKLPFIKRENMGRLKLWLLLLAFLCSGLPMHGEFGLIYNFVRKRLTWGVTEYGIFSAFSSLIQVVGVIMSMGILSHWLKLADPLVGFISGLSQMGGCVLYFFATTSWMMYLAPTVDMMNGTMIVIAKSMMSKLVNQTDEIGKLFSLLSVIDAVMPLVGVPLYNSIYSQSVLVNFEGSIFIVSALLTIPPQLIFLWFVIRRKFANGLPTTTASENSNIEYTDDGSQANIDVEKSTVAVSGVSNPSFQKE